MKPRYINVPDAGRNKNRRSKMEIITQAFGPLKHGTTRIIYKSKKGIQSVVEIENTEPMGEDIRSLFDKYSVFQKVGGLKCQNQ